MVRRTLGIAHTKMDTYKETAEFLSTRQYNDETLTEYLQTIFPAMSKENKKVLSRPATQVMEVLDTQPGAEFGKGSWWQAFNAVTYTTDHLLGHTAESRLQSAWYGPNRGRKVLALEKAVEYADA
jgi:hypothetical protein